jgi:uncharacterized RDD family membrane protein YckC
MSDLPPPPEPPSGGWPQPGAPAPGYGGYGAPPQSPPGAGPWGAPSSHGYGGSTPGGYAAQKAGFWNRFLGYFIDALIVGAFTIPAYIALMAGDTKVEPCRIEDGEAEIFSDLPDNGLCETPTSGTWAMFGILLAAGFVASIVYFGYMEGKRGQTLGKMAAGVKVVDINTGQPIGVGRAVGRWFARILSGIPCYLGYLWMLWDDQSQTWHDKLTSAVVIRT